VRNIVLIPINTMIEFKQIIGRGTRLYDGKDYFTIFDFVKAYHHFSYPEWDGEPVEPQEPKTPRPRGGEDQPESPEPTGGDEPPEPARKLKIKLADGKERAIRHMMATTFWSANGRPMSAAQFVERLFGELPTLFADEDELRALWSEPATRKALLERLAEKGFGDAQLAEIKSLIDAEKSDLYDVLAYIAFALSPITREERVQTRKGNIFAHYGDDNRLDARGGSWRSWPMAATGDLGSQGLGC
jgi:type I restriction enzyme, R subunit